MKRFKTIELSGFKQTKEVEESVLRPLSKILTDQAIDKISKQTSPYTIYFVYPKDGSPVIVKGMYNEVRRYVNTYYPVALYRYTMWRNGESRGAWRFTCKHKFVQHNRRYDITIYGSNGKSVVAQFSLKRMPHKWIPEFDLEHYT